MATYTYKDRQTGTTVEFRSNSKGHAEAKAAALLGLRAEETERAQLLRRRGKNRNGNKAWKPNRFMTDERYRRHQRLIRNHHPDWNRGDANW